MGIQERFKKTAFNTVFAYLERDPEKNLMKVMDWVDALAGDGEDSFPVQRAAFRKVLGDPGNNMHRLIMDILENVDREVLARFCQNSIGPLLEHDKQGDTQLAETLNQYFLHNGSISDAAKAMYIHRNTYIYRLDKIKALLGTDLRDPRTLLQLQLAFLARSILKE